MSSEYFSYLDARRKELEARPGYIKPPTPWVQPKSEDNYLQYQWRIWPARPWDWQQCTTAVLDALLDALIVQGGIPANDGDGVSCVVQMIKAQWDRAETAAARIVELEATLAAVTEQRDRLRRALKSTRRNRHVMEQYEHVHWMLDEGEPWSKAKEYLIKEGWEPGGFIQKYEQWQAYMQQKIINAYRDALARAAKDIS